MKWLLGLFGGSSIGLWIAGGLLAAGIGAWGVQTVRLDNAETDLAQERQHGAERERELAEKVAAAEQRERAIEQSWQARQQEITDATTKRLEAAAAAASAADAAAVGLRSRVAALVASSRRTCGSPAAAGIGATASDPIGVLADVLGRADTRAGILAAEADRRRERALACESAYEVIRDRQARTRAASAP